MSDTKRRVASPRGRAFLDTWVVARGRSQGSLPAADSAPVRPADRRPAPEARPAVQRARSQGEMPSPDSGRIMPPLPDPMPAVRAAIAKAQPLFDAADRVLQAGPVQGALAQAQVTYDTAATQLDIDVLANDDQQAMQGLGLKKDAAQTVLLEGARADAARRKQEQFNQQKALYDEIAPVLDDVKRTYLNPGGSQRIAKEKLSPGRHFQDYLTAMQQVEAAHAATPPNAKDVKQKCEVMVGTAQAYLAHFEKDLSAIQKKDRDNLRKREICEQGLVSARQLALATELDAIGAPDPNQPWNAETEIRAGGLRTAMYFEQGYQQAKSLKDDGAAGKSASYWVKSASVQAGTDQRGRPTATMVANKRGEAIFKPVSGEAAPDNLTGEQQGAGAVKELLASANARQFASMTGIDLGVPETTVAAVGAYAVAGADPNGPPIIGSVQQHAGVSKMFDDLPLSAMENVKPAEAQKIALMDIMSISVDRHAGNLMVDDSDPANLRLVPIDHGATLPTPRQFETGGKFFAGINDSAFGLGVQNVLLGLPAAYENFDPEVVTKLQLLDPDAMEQGMLAQRDALDRVHPSLGAGTKVDAQSFALSKRAMMFLKRAASTLSPAEVQLAIAQNGAELLNAADNQFDGVADRIIADMAPKKSGFKEIFLLSDEDKAEVVNWLRTNGWGGVDFLMSDPVTALKIYKAQTPAAQPAAAPLPYADNPDAMANDATKQAILAEFPDSANGKMTTARWKTMNWNWLTFQQRGRGSYDAAIAATHAPGVGAINEAIAVQNKWQELQDLWAFLNVPPNARGGRMAVAAGSETVLDVLDRTIATETAARHTANVQGVLAQNTDQALQAASAQSRLGKCGQIIQTIEDQTLAATLSTQVAAVQATLVQGDAASADNDAAALLTKVYKLARDEADQTAQRIKADLMRHDLDAGQISELARLAKDVDMDAALAMAQADLVKLRQFEAKITASLPATVQLPGFAWDQANASAAKKQAVKGGLFKDQDTGMTAALAKAIAARAKLAGIRGMDAAAKRKLVGDITAGYNEFGSFVDSKLRPLSGNPSWKAYCDSAAAKVKSDIAQLQQLLGQTATAPAPKVVLPAFTWDPASAAAVTQRAIAAKLFKKKETGMTAALAKVMQVRTQLGSLGTLPVAGQRKLLRDAATAYDAFGRFVAGTLRGLSRDPGWADYCESARIEVATEIASVRQQLADLG